LEKILRRPIYLNGQIVEEYFLSSSPLCALPVRSVDGFRPKAPVSGPITIRLIKAFIEETGFDFFKYTTADKY